MRIFVEGLEFTGAHGVYAEERRDGRRFRVDLSVDTDAELGARSDAIDDTIDYRGLAQIVLEVGHGPSRSLIERLAAQILERVLERYPQVRCARVTIRKFATGVPGDPGCVGVELTRARDAPKDAPPTGG